MGSLALPSISLVASGIVEWSYGHSRQCTLPIAFTSRRDLLVRRRRILSAVGVPFTCIAANFDGSRSIPDEKFLRPVAGLTSTGPGRPKQGVAADNHAQAHLQWQPV
jgi:hypothetical protein